MNEARRTARAIIISTCQRVWSKEARDKIINKILKENESRPEEKKRDAKKLRRAEGSDRVELYMLAVDDFVKSVKRATNLLGKPKWNDIHNRVMNMASKTSAIDTKKRTAEFERNIKKARTTVKAEMPREVDVTAVMDGGVLLRLLTKKNSCGACCKDPTSECSAAICATSVVHAEIAKRKIKMKRGWKKKLNIKEKRDHLRDNELQKEAIDGDKIKGQIDSTTRNGQNESNNIGKGIEP